MNRPQRILAALGLVGLWGCFPTDDLPPDFGFAGADAGSPLDWPRGFDPPGDCAAVYGVPLDGLFDPDVVRLGLLLPESGAAGAIGSQMVQAVALALDELAMLGGLPDGRRVGALACDSRTDPERAFELARWMQTDLPVPAVIGPGLSASTFLLDSGGLLTGGPLFMSPSATHPALADIDDDGRLWRTAPDDGRLGRALGRWLADQPVERVAVVAPDDRFGDALSAALIEALCGGRCPVDRAPRVRYASGDDPARTAQAIRDTGADAIAFLGHPPETGPMLAALADFPGPIGLGETLRDPALLAGLPPALRPRIAGVAHAAGDTATARAFADRFRARWGADPGPFAAEAYDAAWLILHALGALPPGTPLDGSALAARLGRMSAGAPVPAGPDGWRAGQAAFRDPSAGTFDFDGASGPLDFDATGQAPDAIAGWSVGPDGDLVDGGVWLAADDRWSGP